MYVGKRISSLEQVVRVIIDSMFSSICLVLSKNFNNYPIIVQGCNDLKSDLQRLEFIEIIYILLKRTEPIYGNIASENF